MISQRLEATYSHPVFQSPATRLAIIAAIIMRAIFLWIMLLMLDNALELGTSLKVLGPALVVGTVYGSLSAFSRLRTFGFIISLGGICIFIWLLTILIGFLPFNKPGSFFTPVAINDHVWISVAILVFSATTTWAFWKFRHALTLEILAILALIVHLLSGHRNYHFDSPRILNNLAWTLGVQQLWIFILVGAALSVTMLLYLFCTTRPIRAEPYFEFVGFRPHRGRVSWLLGIFFASLLALLLYLICSFVFNHYQREVLSRTANGVGEESKEGLSPLDFHSALGSTQQPAGLVRLEGDYAENPFSPMLYLRESALSDINGNQMVIANSRFDQDVAGSDPKQSWVGSENSALFPRVPLNQSMYLLTEHKMVFAVDYPASIHQIKNPDPKRFKSSYRAYSVAPAYSIEEIRNSKVGDPDWSDDVWQHYLRTHSDSRYGEIARKIVGEEKIEFIPVPVFSYFIQVMGENHYEIIDKWLYQAYNFPPPQVRRFDKTAAHAFSIIEYLSKNAIYTLSPNHDIGPNDDPVAKFLFGDRRGYCVHFAHATVYMLRSLGIPSRIATGYLTDLSQSRDGHILLRMSDRHAWAEVYVQQKGWVPFDTQPDQVESHADTQVDMKLLEELMGMLGPSEDILPPDIAEGEANFAPVDSDFGIDLRYFWGGALILFLFGLLVKTYLRYGWLITGSAPGRLRSSYLAVLSLLYDLGYRRHHGETREEFRRRITQILGGETLTLTSPLNVVNYSSRGNDKVTAEVIDSMRAADLRLIRSLPIWKRIIGALNPSSLFAFLTRVRW